MHAQLWSAICIGADNVVVVRLQISAPAWLYVYTRSQAWCSGALAAEVEVLWKNCGEVIFWSLALTDLDGAATSYFRNAREPEWQSVNDVCSQSLLVNSYSQSVGWDVNVIGGKLCGLI